MKDHGWRDGWKNREDYATIFYDRAVGNMPEMESSKAAAMLLKERVRPGDSILDVGCGGGHYLRSMRRIINVDFNYTGVDATPEFLDVARSAWKDDEHASFRSGDIYELPFPDKYFDVVVCNNVLYHLPSIVKPVAELLRVANRLVLVRTLIGQRSFRVQEVFSSAFFPGSEIAPEDEFTDAGEARSFAFLNIYARHYFSAAIKKAVPDATIDYIADVFFDPAAIENSADGEWENPNPTRLLGGRQTIGDIIVPYHFVDISKPDE